MATRSCPLRPAVLALALASTLIVGRSAAHDWPQWRGPNRDGVWAQDGLVERFPPGGPPVRWRAAVGWGWSSPVVARGRVYVTDSELARPAARERVLCFEEATGRPLWVHSYDVTYPDWAFVPGQEARQSATPIIEAGRLYTLGGNGHVHCLDADTGGVLWHKQLEKRYTIDVLKCRASPLIDGDLLILHTGAKPGASVIALDKRTGAEVWRALDDGVSNSSPIVITAGGMRQLIVWTADSVASLDPSTGKTRWREPLVTSNNDAVSTPVHDGDLLLVSGLMMRLDPDKPAAGVLWPKSRAASRRVLSNTSTPLLRGGHVFSAKSTGELVCLEAATGELVWENDEVTGIGSGASIHLTPHGESVFLFTDAGELVLAELAASGYREVGRAKLVEPTYAFSGRKMAWAPPAFANGHVFARNDRELVCAALHARP